MEFSGLQLRVKVEFFSDLREIVGEREKMLEFDNPPTIREVLDLLVKRYGRKIGKKIFDGGKLSEYYIFLLNGQNIRFLKGMDTTLEDRDELAILPPVSGG